MLINAVDPEESRIAVVEDGVLQELHVELSSREAYLGNIYKAKVVNIEPSIGAAFVNFGGRSNGFLHVSDVLPAYARDDFTLEDVIEGRACVTGDEGPDAVRSVLDDDGDEAEEAEEPDAEDRGTSSGEEAGGDHDSSGDPERDPRGRLPADPDAVDSEAGPDDDDERGGDEERDGEAPGAPRRRARRAASANGSESDDETDEAAELVAEEADGEAVTKTATARKSRAKKVTKKKAAKKPPRRRVRRPRITTPIDQLLTRGQELVVQVTKEGIGAKGPTLTTYVSLPGRSLVLMPSLPKCGVSRKIESQKERRRLKKIVRELDNTGNGGIGFIVRTAGINKSKTDLERDRDYLNKIWGLIAQRLKKTRAPALLYQESDLVLKAMRDLFVPDIEEVVVDSKDVFLRIRDFAEKLMPRMADRIRHHETPTPLFHSFGIEAEVQGLCQPKVELPSGISLVFDQTEALVAIDINSGKFKPGVDLEETAYKTNMEAIPEIVRQLRLRDLGGVIIVDFIDMTDDKHKRALERKLVESLRGDRARVKVGKISAFGMMEITRQRVGPGLKHTVFSTCPHCHGAGLARTVQSRAVSTLRDVRAMLPLKGFSILQIYASPPVAEYLVNYKRRTLMDLEEALGKSLAVKTEPSYPVDVVHYRFMTADGQEAKVVIPAGLGVRA
ncbi:MAG: Rne/Rng family ribonuclease [Planctomycetota bacterium]